MLIINYKNLNLTFINNLNKNNPSPEWYMEIIGKIPGLNLVKSVLP